MLAGRAGGCVQNTSKLESVREVVVRTGGVACVELERVLIGGPESFERHLVPDTQRFSEGDASAVHGCAGRVGQAERGTAE